MQRTHRENQIRSPATAHTKATAWYPDHVRRDTPVIHPQVLPLIAAVAVSLVVNAAPLFANDDLTVPSPTYPEAVEAMRAGNSAAALEQLDAAIGVGTPPLEALVLRATLLDQLGRPAADGAWNAVIEREVWMRTFARRALVVGRTDRGNLSGARSLLTDLDRADATRHIDLAMDLAAAAGRGDDPAMAAELYRSVLRRRSRGATADRARLGLAAAQEASGDVVAALTTLRETQLEHRTGLGYTDAVAAESRLLAVSGRAARPLTAEQHQTLVRRLRGYSRYTEAAALIEAWRAVAPEAAEQIDAELVGVLYDGRANEDAVALCLAFADRYPSSALLPGVRLTEFRLAVRMGDTAKAKRLGQVLWRGGLSGSTASDRFAAGELLAAYLVAVGEIDEALRLYRELFQGAQGGDAQRRMLWKAGVAALRAGDANRALTNLRALNRRNPTGDLEPAGIYWQAVAELTAGEEQGQAHRALNRLVQTRPHHYYGLQAAARLKELGADLPSPAPREFPTLTLEASTRARAEFKAAMTLARAGLVNDAAWYLRRLLEDETRNRALALLATRASAEGSAWEAVPRLLVTHFAGYLQQGADALPEDFYQLVYPRPYDSAVTPAAADRDIDPGLMFSLMRQESRFDADARSFVGALGLFQIMTYTATELGPRSGLDELSAADLENEEVLLRPEVNASIAATLAGDLLTMFSGQLAPVIASYNAGEERVAIWWESAQKLSEDLFVDTIPYSETRRFVREVLANVAGYQRVYGTTQ